MSVKTCELLAAHLERKAAFDHDFAAKYRALAAATDRGEYGDSPQTKSIRIAAVGGLRINKALGDWSRWAFNHEPHQDQSRPLLVAYEDAGRRTNVRSEFEIFFDCH